MVTIVQTPPTRPVDTLYINQPSRLVLLVRSLRLEVSMNRKSGISLTNQLGKRLQGVGGCRVEKHRGYHGSILGL